MTKQRGAHPPAIISSTAALMALCASRSRSLMTVTLSGALLDETMSLFFSLKR
jgi:hypothetical protein